MKIFVFVFIVSEATRICQEWVVAQTFQDTHKVLVPQFWCFATAVQCFVQSLLSVLRHATPLVLVVLQTNLGRYPRAGMLCARQLQL